MGRIGRRALIAGGLVLGLATPALAEVKVSQSADRTTVGSDDTFGVTVTISGLEHPAELALPRSPDLQILGQSQSTQTSITSGSGGVHQERQEQVHLQMRATHAGSITIPGAVVTTGGATLRAEPLELDVRSGHVAAPHTAAPDPNDPFAAFGLRGFGAGTGLDPFGDDDEEDPLAALRGAERLSPSDVRLVTTLDRRSAYVGEQATLELWLLTRVGVSVGGLEMPKVDGALSEEIATPQHPQEKIRTVDGVRYHAFLLAKRALFAQQAGRLAVGPAQLEATTNGLFQRQRVTRRSSPLTLEVRPLPPGGPAGEAVGDWTLRANVSSLRAAAGEPITLRLTAEGTGDVKALALPAPPPIAGVDAYAPTVTDTPAIRQGLVGGKRVSEIVLLPRRAGDFTVPALALPYFDPKSGRHHVARTRPLVLHVTPGSAAAASLDAAPLDAAPAATSAPDALIRPLRAPVSLAPAAPRPWRTLAFWLLIALPALLCAAVAVWARVAPTERRPSARRRLRAARRHLARAERLRDRPVELFGAIERSLHELCAAHLAHDVRGLSRDALAAELATSRLSERARGRLLEALERSHAARFAPAAVGGARIDDTLAIAHEVLEERSAA